MTPKSNQPAEGLWRVVSEPVPEGMHMVQDAEGECVCWCATEASATVIARNHNQPEPASEPYKLVNAEKLREKVQFILIEYTPSIDPALATGMVIEAVKAHLAQGGVA